MGSSAPHVFIFAFFLFSGEIPLETQKKIGYNTVVYALSGNSTIRI